MFQTRVAAKQQSAKLDHWQLLTTMYCRQIVITMTLTTGGM